MRRVVDGLNTETDDEIDQDDRQDARADSSFEKRWDGAAISDPEYQQNAEQAKDRARRACGYRLRVVEIASTHSGNARDHIKNNEALTSIQLLHLRPDDP